MCTQYIHTSHVAESHRHLPFYILEIIIPRTSQVPMHYVFVRNAWLLFSQLAYLVSWKDLSSLENCCLFLQKFFVLALTCPSAGVRAGKNKLCHPQGLQCKGESSLWQLILTQKREKHVQNVSGGVFQKLNRVPVVYFLSAFELWSWWNNNPITSLRLSFKKISGTVQDPQQSHVL